jgi:DEAD/DEAH box helicase domain-containing protein
VDYYTQASADTQIEVLATHEERSTPHLRIAYGDLLVQSQVVGFRRIRRYTHEHLGTYPLDYPPEVSETSGYWFGILPEAQRQLEAAGLWYDSLNDYGPNWQEQRERVRQRDGYRCAQCRSPEPPGRQHDVHHLVPFRTFGYVPGLNENYLLANRLENLTLLCRSCHRRAETAGQIHTGLDGLSYALSNLAPLYLMCDPRDLGLSVVRVERATNAQAEPDLPTIYLYEQAIAGLGFAARLYELHDQLLLAVGPILEQPTGQLPTKQLTLALLNVLIEGRLAPAPPVTGDVEFW